MKIPPFSPNPMTTPTPRERLTRRPEVVLFLFMLITVVVEMGRPALYSLGVSFLPPGAGYEQRLLVSLFATTLTVAVVLIFCLVGERRTLASLGLSRRGFPLEYPLGLVGGLALFGASVLLCVATGTLTLTATGITSVGLWLLFIPGFLIQGMSEELLCRSYLMVSLSRGFPLRACAGINALLFSLLHMGNTGIGIISLINIFLFGLFASLLALRRGSIWMVGGIHSAWNFAQGNLFGIPVSGIVAGPAPLSARVADGAFAGLWTGGSFGLEGGLAVTLILALACILALLIPSKSFGDKPSSV